MEIATIYKQFHSGLLGYVTNKVRSKQDAEDILQNVFIRISSNIDKLKDEVKLKSWLFAIARNAIIDYYRVKANKRDVAVTADIDEHVFAADDPDPTKGLDQCLSSMIGLLPEEYRAIIIDAEINGIKQKDLTDKYGLAYPSVRSRVQRGRERLKQLFLDCCHIETDRQGNVIDARGKKDCEGPCDPCAVNND
jgi:RNA polymerase sigma-70 factor (ECF subfamily)